MASPGGQLTPSRICFWSEGTGDCRGGSWALKAGNLILLLCQMSGLCQITREALADGVPLLQFECPLNQWNGGGGDRQKLWRKQTPFCGKREGKIESH